MTPLYEGYLTEKKVEPIIEKIFDGFTVTKQKKFKGNDALSCDVVKRMSFDFFVEELGIVVEFDGDGHYNKPDVIRRDKMKTLFCINNDFKEVRIPYFVQLTVDALYYFFGGFGDKVDENIRIISKTYEEPSFSHGFVDKKCEVPSSFTHQGHERFFNEMCFLSSYFPPAFINIYNSLIDKIVLKEYSMRHNNLSDNGFCPFVLAFDCVIGRDTPVALEFFGYINDYEDPNSISNTGALIHPIVRNNKNEYSKYGCYLSRKERKIYSNQYYDCLNDIDENGQDLESEIVKVWNEKGNILT